MPKCKSWIQLTLWVLSVVLRCPKYQTSTEIRSILNDSAPHSLRPMLALLWPKCRKVLNRGGGWAYTVACVTFMPGEGACLLSGPAINIYIKSNHNLSPTLTKFFNCLTLTKYLNLIVCCWESSSSAYGVCSERVIHLKALEQASKWTLS